MTPLMERVFGLQAEARREVPPVPTHPFGLSPREVEVLRLIASGKTNRQIADELVISSRTVDQHVRNILAKMACDNRAEAVARAAHEGLV